MRNSFRTAGKKILLLAEGSLWGAVISIAPIALVHHRHIELFFQNFTWPFKAFSFLCIITGGIVRLCLPSVNINRKFVLIFSYLFCYTTCSALCHKLSLTTCTVPPSIKTGTEVSNAIFGIASTILGLLIVSLAALIQIKAALTQNDKKIVPASRNISKSKISKHPFYFSWFLFMTGVPFIFGVWLPLIALPGALIVLKWLD